MTSNFRAFFCLVTFLIKQKIDWSECKIFSVSAKTWKGSERRSALVSWTATCTCDHSGWVSILNYCFLIPDVQLYVWPWQHWQKAGTLVGNSRPVSLTPISLTPHSASRLFFREENHRTSSHFHEKISLQHNFCHHINQNFWRLRVHILSSLNAATWCVGVTSDKEMLKLVSGKQKLSSLAVSFQIRSNHSKWRGVAKVIKWIKMLLYDFCFLSPAAMV